MQHRFILIIASTALLALSACAQNKGLEYQKEGQHMIDHAHYSPLW